MRITQVQSSSVVGRKHVGQWYCSDSIPGIDGDPIFRYLQHDGSWGKTTDYFATKEEIDLALSKGLKPDFTLTQHDLFNRAMIRQDIEDAFNDWE